MGSFDEYNLAKKKQEELFRGDEKRQEEWQPIDLFHQDYEGDIERELQNKGLGENVEDEAQSLSYVEETIRLKEAGSTFEERTEYYFADTKYMEAKETRYRALADDAGGDVAAFAKKHKNRSAKKRKKSAKAAADCFSKARKLEEDFAGAGGEDLPAEDIYEARNEIMQARLQGMINAAKVKATSKQDENYRIAKAKLSCLATLYDQAKNLRAAQSEHFDKIQEDLKQQMEEVKLDLKKYGQDPDARWMESQGCNDTRSIKKEIKDSGNPYATVEDVKVGRIMRQVASEYERPEYVEAQKIINEKETLPISIGHRRDELIAPINLIRRDAHGNPISKEEKRKEEWNKRWLDACKDPEKVYERKAMLIESFERVKKFNFPSPDELKGDGLKNLIKKDPVGMYSICQYALRLDNIRPMDPIINEYMSFDKEFFVKMEAAAALSNLIKDSLTNEFELIGGTFRLIQGDRWAGKSDDEIDEEKGVYNEARERAFNDYVKFHERIAPAEKAAEDHVKRYEKENVNSYANAVQKGALYGVNDVTKEEYRAFMDFKKTNQQIECPAYITAYSAVEQKLGSSKDISRVLGAVLRPVHFNKEWIPVSKADMEAHEYNIKILNNLNTYFNGPNLEFFKVEKLEIAKKNFKEGIKLSDKQAEEYKKQGREVWEKDGEYYTKQTEEEYNNLPIVKEVNESKAVSEQILKDMIREEYKRNFVDNRIALPAPEMLKQQILDGLNNGDSVLNIPILEDVLKDKDAFAKLASNVLAYEGALDLPFAKELKEEFEKDIEPYANALRSFVDIADAYYSKKFRVKINTGNNATQNAYGGQFFNEEGAEFLIDKYKGDFEKFNSGS